MIVVAAAFLLATHLAAKDDKTFVMPKAANARTYPAHDSSGKEKVAIAANPYDVAGDADRYQ